MSYINEDDYMNAVDYIRNLSEQIRIDPSLAVPDVNKIEDLELLLDMIIGSKKNEKFSVALEFFEKYKV